MEFSLSNLPKTVTVRPAKRLGRGQGSGKSKTSGRGQKGQTSRTGAKIPAWFEGGQNPLIHRLPHKGGFQSPHPKVYTEVNLERIEKVYSAEETVSPETLREKGVVHSVAEAGVKVLADGNLTKPLKFMDVRFSKAAEKKIKEVGGSMDSALSQNSKLKTQNHNSKVKTYQA